MSEEAKRKFSELNMTRDELDRFTEAMKKEEFRKLLVEYAEELSDPKNREQYEKEIAQLEEERGMNVTFIHPEKGFCLKTTQNGALKCFINIWIVLIFTTSLSQILLNTNRNRPINNILLLTSRPIYIVYK